MDAVRSHFILAIPMALAVVVKFVVSVFTLARVRRAFVVHSLNAASLSLLILFRVSLYHIGHFDGYSKYSLSPDCKLVVI